jgi:hypothetical protein
VAPLDGIVCPAIVVMEFVVGEVGTEVDATWHAPVLQLHAATPYKTIMRGDVFGALEPDPAVAACYENCRHRDPPNVHFVYIS